jgi:hypothetical protein
VLIIWIRGQLLINIQGRVTPNVAVGEGGAACAPRPYTSRLGPTAVPVRATLGEVLLVADAVAGQRARCAISRCASLEGAGAVMASHEMAVFE